MNKADRQALDHLGRLVDEYRQMAYETNQMFGLDPMHALGFRMADDALEKHMDDLKDRVRREALEDG